MTTIGTDTRCFDRQAEALLSALPCLGRASVIMPARVRDLVHQSAGATERFRETHERLNFLHGPGALLQESSGLGDLLKQLDTLQPVGNTAKELDAYEKTEPKGAVALATAMGCLKPEEVFQSFGLEAVIWSRLHDFYQIARRDAVQEFLVGAGCAEPSLWPAFFNTTLPFVGDKACAYISTLQMLERLKIGAAAEIPLTDLIEDCGRAGAHVSGKRSTDYKLEMIFNPDIRHGICDENWVTVSKQGSPGRTYRIWTDAPAGVIVCYKGSPNLAITARPLSDSELFIEQIQHVNGHRLVNGKWERMPPRGMAPLDSMRLGMLVGEQLAAILGFDRTTCIGAGNIRWTKIRYYGGQGDPHLPIEKARRMYDDTACKMFEPTAEGNWSKTTRAKGFLSSRSGAPATICR